MTTLATTPAVTPQTREATALQRSTRARRWTRSASVGLLATVLSVTTLSVGGAGAATTAAAHSAIVAVDWSDGHSGQGWSSGADQSPWGSSTGSAGTATVDSDPATDAQSVGVVLIDTELGYQDASAAGTGIVLTSSGEVLTNYHVVAGATSISVTVASTGKSYTATVVGDSETGDVALLQLKGASGLRTAQIDDDTVSTGDSVTAVGNAGGTDSLTAAAGTVSALQRDITTESEGSAAGEDLVGLIETSADVVAGDSGGPLYDAEGEVVGIDTAASTGTEINGYAIPIENALTIVKEILSGQETSTVQIGSSAFLGVEVSADTASTDDAYYGYGGLDTSATSSDPSGAEVAGVVAGSPAADAGLGAGDVITAVGGTSVSSADDLTSALSSRDPGDRVTISWTNTQGASQSATVTLATSPVA